MALLLTIILHMVLMSTEFVIGIIVNGFLIIMSCNDLIKSRRLILLQILLLCIGISRFGLQIILIVQSLYSVFFPLAYQANIYGAKMMFFWMFFNSLSLWFATSLSIFYCLKIATFTHSCFLWLKFRISKLILWLLLVSLLASLSTAAVCTKVELPKIDYADFFTNTTLKSATAKIKNNNELLLVNLALILPLFIFVMCTCMLFISLYKHTHRIQNGPHGFPNAQREAHINALRTVITFFCFFISYFAAFMTNMTFQISYRSQQFFVVKDIMAAYPAGHSIIIILSNSKLQQSFRRILCLKRK
ncbi:taste receptor type 2 member 2-like [Callospermophilus lateralis]|uniref:taste receptor type 2 member 2-like n=1 Tax=Callospermophilus lateralis TaxID=76772 RepID=UPI004053E0CE